MVFFEDLKVYVLALLMFVSLLDFIIYKTTRSLIASIFFLFILILKDDIFVYLYPVLVSFCFLFVFAYSLKNEAVITKIARFKNPNLSDEAVLYTRKLTKIWICFFCINILIICILLIFENKFFWAIYCGFISYLIMGILFVGEIVFRKVVLKV